MWGSNPAEGRSKFYIQRKSHFSCYILISLQIHKLFSCLKKIITHAVNRHQNLHKWKSTFTLKYYSWDHSFPQK
jgi:hypothetical protein